MVPKVLALLQSTSLFRMGPVGGFPVIAGNTMRPTSSTGAATLAPSWPPLFAVAAPQEPALELQGQSAWSNARTPALAQSSRSGLLMPGTVALQLLFIDPVLSRMTSTFSGCTEPPRAPAMELAETVNLGRKSPAKVVFTVAVSVTLTALQVVTPDGCGACAPEGWQLALLVSVGQVGVDPAV